MSRRRSAIYGQRLPKERVGQNAAARPRLASVLSVFSSLLVGGILVVAPWTALWDNSLLAAHPALRAIVVSTFARGAVTGLGLVNVVLAFHEAVQILARPQPPDGLSR